MPHAVKIPWDSPRHQKVKEAIVDRIKLSRQKMQERYDHFRKAEEMYLAYIPESEADRLKRAKREQQGTQTYTTIEIPYSYAVLMAAHMYWTSVFLGRSPIHQYTGRHGETEHRVQALEALVDYQVSVGQMLMPYYVWLLDAGKYGLGVVGTYWSDEYEIISTIEEQAQTVNGVPLIGMPPEQVRVSRRFNTYRGNRAYNIRPQDFLPDPRVPITRFQDGEFAGRRTDVSWNFVRKQEHAGRYFNVDRLKQLRFESNRREQGSAQVILPATTVYAENAAIRELGTVEIFEMCVEIIPKDWDLGASNYPEKWVFTIAGEELIIGAQPLGEYHNKFPFDIMEYEIDGYSLFKRSMLEIIDPLNKVVSWLFNAHFYNVRKSLNNQFIVDPSRVTMKDITDPAAGKVIRLKPAAYGQDVRTIVTQLNVQDMTSQHIRDIAFVEQLIQRVSGVVDSVMGMPKRGGRATATEVRTTSGFSINRLKTNAEYMSTLGFSQHSAKLVQNTLQHYDQEKMFRVAGAVPQGMNPFVMVTPDSIVGQYDFVPVDGTMPVDRFAMVQLWTELLGQMVNFPAILQRYDLGEIFAYVAQLGGIKNLKQFQVQVRPDGMLEQQAAAGNVIPLGGPPNGERPNPRRTEGAGAGSQSLARISGMGAAG